MSSRRRVVVSLAVLALGVARLTACTSDFHDCEDVRSCEQSSVADGGEAGATSGSAAGAGGGAPVIDPDNLPPLPTDCEKNLDCDDYLQCTGLETCFNGTCIRSDLPCVNDDPDHCAMTCVEGADGAECGIQGLDADGDGHLDAACAAKPGDDCDDDPTTGPNVNPGVAEVCNGGVDDDCDGNNEVTGAVAAPSAAAVLIPPVSTSGRDQVRIVANAVDGGFGVAWTDYRNANPAQGGHIYFALMAADGTLSSAQTRVIAGGMSPIFKHPDLDWDVDHYRVVFRENSNLPVWGIREYTIDPATVMCTLVAIYAPAEPSLGPQVGGGVFIYSDAIRECGDNSDVQCDTSILGLPLDSVHGIAASDGTVVFTQETSSHWLIQSWTPPGGGMSTVFTSDTETAAVGARNDNTRSG